MLMLQMSGGLGNQMFLYALYLALKDMGREVCIDDYTMYKAIGRTDDCLERIFNLSYLHAERDEYIRLTDSSLAFKDRVRRKLTGRRGKLYTEKDAITYEEGIFEVLDAYCIGYWQSERYFERVKEQVREQFRFLWDQFSERTREYKKRIETCNAISIHVRRGDYLNEKFAPIYGGICTEEYYRAAVDYCRTHFKDCVFFLFTNDPVWGRTVTDQDIVLVDCNDEGCGEQDMALMSCCRHHIIANSSFSWWGAWLGQNPDKTVIAPDKWLNTSEGQDIYYKACTMRIDSGGRCMERLGQ